jgi:1-acyl-sn-glycerol-3-phosphate acyltransferase
MLRAFLLVYPFLVVYVMLGTLIFVPLTWLIRDIRPIYWVARTGVRIALLLSGVRVKLVNLEYAFQHPRSVFLSNHVSNIEPAALFMVLPRITIVLKKELGRIPLLGYVMKLGGFIYVDRMNRDSRRLALEGSVDALKKGISLMIFPEGTRSLDGGLLPFRPGPFTIAIEAQAPVVPVTVHGTRELMPKGQGYMRPGKTSLVFHPPILTEGLTSQDRAALMRQVREVMEKGMDRLHLVSHSR